MRVGGCFLDDTPPPKLKCIIVPEVSLIWSTRLNAALSSANPMPPSPSQASDDQRYLLIFLRHLRPKGLKTKPEASDTKGLQRSRFRVGIDLGQTIGEQGPPGWHYIYIHTYVRVCTYLFHVAWALRHCQVLSIYGYWVLVP